MAKRARCRAVRANRTFAGKLSFTCLVGISAETADATGIASTS